MGKSVIREDHPLYVGVYGGLIGRDEVQRFVNDTDCLLMIGSILGDDLCIAVITGQNPNVFYELAIAQCAARPVIILVEKGQVMCLIGPSGSGKSTLLRCTNGLETIDSGAPQTPFMKVGDTVSIDMTDDSGNSIFGRILQKVVKAR